MQKKQGTCTVVNIHCTRRMYCTCICTFGAIKACDICTCNCNFSNVYELTCSTGDAQSLSCDSSIAQPLCPGTITKCTCATTGIITRWNFPTLNQCAGNIIILTQVAPCSSSSGTCGAYLSAANNSPSQAGSACPSSTLTITAVNQSLNGLTIECRDISSGSPGTLIGTGNISIAG